MDWNEKHQELIVIDSGGWLYVWNIYMEKCVLEHQLRREILPPGMKALDHSILTSISIRPQHQTLVVAGGNRVEQW